MKMIFRQQNNNFVSKNPRKKNTFLSFFLVILFIIIFSFPWAKNILFGVGSPFWIIKNGINTYISDNIGVLYTKKLLLSQNESLRTQIKLNEKNLAIFNLLKNENGDLKTILGRKKDGQKLLLSSVLVKPFLSAYDTLIIDVGSSDLVNVGDKVLADGNVFIGYVSEVYNNTSKVVLYSSPGEKVKILVGGNNLEKEAVGIGGGNFKIEIPKEIGVKEGDIIVIPSVSLNVFGVVEKVEYKDSDSFQNILFKNPVNILELKWVEVILSNKKQ